MSLLERESSSVCGGRLVGKILESEILIWGKEMKYAVPVTKEVVSSHFGHCSHFALFAVDEQTGVITNKDVVASPGHEPGVLPAWLAEQGVSVVIAGGMGNRAQDLFQQNRIKVVVGAPDGDPEKIVVDFLNGSLMAGENLCDH